MLKYTLTQKARIKLGNIPGAKRFYCLLRLLFAPTYREDGLATVHNCDFLTDEDFIGAYETALKQEVGVDIRWRAHVTQWAGFHAKQLDGDFVECGVNRAFLSSSVMAYVDFESLKNRKFYLFDTFSGLIEELITLEDRAAHRHHYSDCYEFVVNSFNDYSNVVIVRGAVPTTLDQVKIDRVAYLSIDMNCAMPEIAALEYFWPKMTPGGIIILDDYGFDGHIAQKKGADEFASSIGVRILSLPTGQGLLIKPK